MGWFKKDKVLDFSSLRKDVVKKPDYVEIGNVKNEPENGLGFLGVMANSAESSNSLGDIENIHIKDLKVKIDDINYKLDSFSKRISSLIDRVDLLEKKVDRDLRRSS